MGAIFERSGALLKEMTECYISAARDEPENARFYVAHEGDQIVGTAFCYLKAGIAGVHNVGVLSDYRNRGLGSALVCAAANDALGNEAGSVWLRTVTGEYAEKLYLALGFQKLTHCYAFRPKVPP
jgi:N-acetylglutamate synthase-like GNAT family acetyltransferase